MEQTPLLATSARRNPSRRVGWPVLVVSALVAVSTLTLAIQQIIAEPRSNSPYDSRGRLNPAILATGDHAGVASENPICSDIGVSVLKRGGNAVDAAVASTLCTGVLNMFSSGIGGGGFMIIRTAEGDYTTIDFRETGPAAANATMYEGRMGEACFGGLSVGVPGELRGLELAHTKYGSLPWKELVMPSVHLARESKVSKELARRLQLFGGFMLDDPVWADIFVNKATGRLMTEGDVFRRTAYARTLETIANEGVEAFYRGKIANSIVETVQAQGGILTREDMAGYAAIERPALQGSWRGRRVFTTPAPTSGPVLLSMLNVFSSDPDFLPSIFNGLTAHRFIEALKFGFAQRTEIGDPAYLDTESRDVVADIPSAREAARIASRITDDRTHKLAYYGPKFDIVHDHGTMHVSLVDRDGMAVSLTSTVNLIFGSRVMDATTGVIMNDEMDDTSTPGVPNAFGLAPSPYNYPAPGKRPLSSTCPTIVEDERGNFELAIGGSGGSRIFSSVLQTMLNLDAGVDVSAAIEAPRIHHQLLPTQVSAESFYPSNLIQGLEKRGHEISYIDINSGVAEVQAVQWVGSGRHRKVHAASDSRKGGVAAAY